MGTPFFSVKALIDKEGGGGGESASKTSELKLTTSSLESISGTATTQEGANSEVVSEIKNSLTKYSATKSYKADDVAYYDGNLWKSLQNSNKGNTPAEDSEYWELSKKILYTETKKFSEIESINHNLNSKNIDVQFFEANENTRVYLSWAVMDENDIDVYSQIDYDGEIDGIGMKKVEKIKVVVRRLD